MSIYDFTVKDNRGNEVSLADYKGKVLLVVNTATGCGFTPHYEALEKLYEAKKDEGFAVLDFPCNQFGSQTPGTDEEVHAFCTAKYATTFPRFRKCDVNGENALPLWKWLTENTKFEGFTGPMAEFMDKHLAAIDPDFKNNSAIKWNFTKFLIGRDGEIIARFEPTEDMSRVAECVAKVL